MFKAKAGQSWSCCSPSPRPWRRCAIGSSTSSQARPAPRCPLSRTGRAPSCWRLWRSACTGSWCCARTCARSAAMSRRCAACASAPRRGSDLGLGACCWRPASIPTTTSASARCRARPAAGVSFGVTAAQALADGRLDGFWANGMGAEVAVRRGVGTIVLDMRRGEGPPAGLDVHVPGVRHARSTLIAEHPETGCRSHPRRW